MTILNEQIIYLRQADPLSDVPAKLRDIAAAIEAGEYEFPISTAVVVLGHTQERPVDDEAEVIEWWVTSALGPRNDPFTVRGLLLSAATRLSR